MFEKFLSDIKAQLSKALGQNAAGKSAGSGTRAAMTDADRKLAADILAGVVAQVRHEEDLVAARGKEPISVRLVPQVPVRDLEGAAAWLGGGARLPAGVAWPVIDGVALQLLAEIDCSRLPTGLWSGLGPRHGWLAIFLEPATFKTKVMHFDEAGDFKSSPPAGPDCNMIGYDARKRAEASGFTRGFARWPVDVVAVGPGAGAPEFRGTRLGDERYATQRDFVDAGLWPFDWPTARMMMDKALAGYERVLPKDPPAKHLTPDTLAALEASIAAAERAGGEPDDLLGRRVDLLERRAMAEIASLSRAHGPMVVARLRALQAKVEGMAAREPFSAAAIAPILHAMQAMTWTHKRTPPFYRAGRKLPNAERLAEGVQVFTMPLTTHDPAAQPSWVYDYQMELLDQAKPVYLRDPAALPAALRADCELVWADQASREMAGMGHVPWHYVHEFDLGSDVTLIELPSSDLVGWMFGDVDHLVLTIQKSRLARGDFSDVRVQVSN